MTRLIPIRTDTTPAPRRPEGGRVRRFAILGAVGAAGLAFAACGGSSGASTGSTAPGGNGSGGSSRSSTTPSSLPGASGTIASVSGATMEVQNTQAGQTTVTYTPTTTIRQISATTAAAVTVGSCITAFGMPSSAKSSTSGPVTATTVSISQPVSGACGRGGFGGGAGGGARPGGFAGRPGGAEGGSFNGGGYSGSRSGSGSFKPPSGRSFRGGNFGGASGLVTAVSGSAVTVSETNPQTKKTNSVTVNLSSTATFTTTQTATSSAIVVGQCARAVGTAGSTGAVTATSLTISAPTNGSCTTGFGFRGGAAGGAGGAPGAPAGA